MQTTCPVWLRNETRTGVWYILHPTVASKDRTIGAAFMYLAFMQCERIGAWIAMYVIQMDSTATQNINLLTAALSAQ
jgi:hypothetical protein